jgi:regulator of replication initiation timing
MASTRHTLIVCFVLGKLLAQHAVADPEVASEFMAKALPKFAVGAPKAFAPRSPAAVIKEVPAASANPGVHVASGKPDIVNDLDAEIARLGQDNYAMKLEMEKMSERLTQDAMMLEIEKVSQMPAQTQESSDLPLVMGIFSVGATVGALLYTIATKLLSSSRDGTTGLLGGGQGQELQLAGAAAGAHTINCNRGSCSLQTHRQARSRARSLGTERHGG